MVNPKVVEVVEAPGLPQLAGDMLARVVGYEMDMSEARQRVRLWAASISREQREELKTTGIATAQRVRQVAEALAQEIQVIASTV